MLEDTSLNDDGLQDATSSDDALDAYSKAVVGAVELVGPAVVSIYVGGASGPTEAAGRERGGAGSGAEVIGRDESGPAVDSDLRPGDLIVGVNDAPVNGVDALHRHLSRWPVGSPLNLDVVRRTRSLKVELTPREPH